MSERAIDKITATRILSLEKKLASAIKLSVKVQVQHEALLAAHDKAIARLRKAIPHVNFED